MGGTSQLRDVPGIAQNSNGPLPHPKKFTIDVPDALQQDLKGATAASVRVLEPRTPLRLLTCHTSQPGWGPPGTRNSLLGQDGRWAQSGHTSR